jgi:hypothetical protein
MLATFQYFRLLSKGQQGLEYKELISPPVLYGCEIWSLTLKEEHRLRVFEYRMLGRVFGPKKDEMIGGWRKRHEELRNLYPSASVIRMITSRRMRCAGHVVQIGRIGLI